MPSSGWMRLAVTAITVAIGAMPIHAQIVDQLVVNSDEAGPGPVIRRFDRRLNLLGSTPLGTDAISPVSTAIATLPNGDIWVALYSDYMLARMDSTGKPLPSVPLDDVPVNLAASGNGLTYALTGLPVSQTKLYAADFSGEIQWFNPAGPASYTSIAPRKLAVTSTGYVWMGDFTYGACQCEWPYPELTLLAPATGDVLGKIKLPYTATPPAVTSLRHIAAAPDGTIWTTTQGSFQSWLHQVRPDGLLTSFPIVGSHNGINTQVRVDAHGDVWVQGPSALDNGAHLFKYSQLDGSVLVDSNLGGGVLGYALGSSGEELFAVRANGSGFDRRLARLNLVTGRLSSIVIDPPFTSSGIGDGDPTGFIWANVLDQGGDNDGDGATNREETLAGTSPYDATGRPQGPKIYIDFAQSNNAIILKLSDPDGLLNPTGGLSVPTLSVKVGTFGEVFPILLQFLTFVQVSPDGTQATAFFGALPFATGSKLTVDASVADKTGAIGWDWQVTPPGDL